MTFSVGDVVGYTGRCGCGVVMVVVLLLLRPAGFLITKNIPGLM